MNETTNTSWATRWMASSGTAVQNGEVVRSWGKDADGNLVAVRTDTGTYPVRNLPAVLAHQTPGQRVLQEMAAKPDSLERYYAAGSPGSYQQWLDARKPARPMVNDDRHYYEPSQYGDNCAVCGNSQNTTVHKR